MGQRRVDYLAPGGVRSIAMSVSVCLSLSVRWHTSKTTRPNFTKFSVHLNVAVARFASDDNAICYVLSVLWKTSSLLIIGQAKVN